MRNLRTLFPDPADLMRLEPEELAGIMIEIVPSISQGSTFSGHSFAPEMIPQPAGDMWRGGDRGPILAIGEAMQWLMNQGLVMPAPSPNASYYVLTRRGASLKTRVDVEAFSKGGVLPIQLLQPHLADKVHHLFVRGDHDTAVFQAFKEVEVSVRKTCGWGDDVLGVTLMRRAFHPEIGPLTDTSKVVAEREADVSLFAGAVGHAKNPASHREVSLVREEAARLIVFASHLLAIVEERAGR